MRLLIKLVKTSLILFILTLAGCGETDLIRTDHEDKQIDNSSKPVENKENQAQIPKDEEQEQDSSVTTVEEVALVIVNLLNDYDLIALSELVHPDHGVRFSPYSFVEPDLHVVFQQSQLSALAQDTTIYQWGYYDGIGEPIELTFAEYYHRFIYDQDYINAESIHINERYGQGNSLDNSAEIYPNGTVVEFHFSGFEAQYEGMDWRSLRLVLEQDNNQWYLIAIIHDEWTI